MFMWENNKAYTSRGSTGEQMKTSKEGEARSSADRGAVVSRAVNNVGGMDRPFYGAPGAVCHVDGGGKAHQSHVTSPNERN